MEKPADHAPRVPTLEYARWEPAVGRGFRIAVRVFAVIWAGVMATAVIFFFRGDPDTGKMEAYFGVGLVAVGASLLFIPVTHKPQRPRRRRTIWIPIIGAACVMTFLWGCVAFATDDAYPWMAGWVRPWMAWGTLGVVWTGWAIAFWAMTRSLDPLSASARIYQALLAGCLLELLVAVPMHLVARRRPECCAGIASGVAIAVGACVAVIALGPGIFFLISRRRRKHYVR